MGKLLSSYLDPIIAELHPIVVWQCKVYQRCVQDIK